MNGSDIANCTSLYVKNVDIMTTDSDLRKAFDQFGLIQSVALRCDRGFAFVYYHTPEPVHAAMKARSDGKVSELFCSTWCSLHVQVCELSCWYQRKLLLVCERYTRQMPRRAMAYALIAMHRTASIIVRRLFAVPQLRCSSL